MFHIKKLNFEDFKNYIEEEKNLTRKKKYLEDEHNMLGSYKNTDVKAVYYGLFYETKQIGFAVIDADTRRLHFYYIGKEHRRRGNGLRFLFKLRVESLDVRRDNKQAIRIYERYGMVEKMEDSNHIVMTMVKV